MRKQLIVLVWFIVFSSFVGCKDTAENGLTSVANAVMSLDTTAKQVSADATNESGRWQELFRKLPKDMSENLEKSMRESISDVGERVGLTIDYGEFKFQSNVDSLREHLLDGLLEIQKGDLKNVDALLQLAHNFKFTPVLANPMWKTPVPRKVQLDWTSELVEAKATTVELDGFAFQRRQRTDPSWRLEFYGPDKVTKRIAITDAWKHLTIHSNFKATLHLNELVEQARRDDSVLVIAYGESGKNCRSEIDLIHKTVGPAPETKTIQVALGSQSCTPPQVKNGADDNFWGRIRFTVSAECRTHEGKLQTRVYMFATEVDDQGRDRHDHTTVDGWSGWHDAYIPEPGWKIAPAIQKNTRYPKEGFDNIHESNPQPIRYTMPNAELVGAFHVRGVKAHGKAGSNDTSVMAEFNRMEVRLERIQPQKKKK
jgi:hypothetical protein